jgi:protein-S-isoprenylcysteine O-methyltransferase Ste14
MKRIGPWFWARVALGLAAFLAVLFLSAGTLAWQRGWLFVGVMVVAGTALTVYVGRVNPEIYEARSRFRKGTKRWDAILIGCLIPAMIAIFVVAALDDGRFHWRGVPWWIVAVGYGAFLVGLGWTAWAEAVNKFFEPTVRLQTDRGHTVIDTGPYAIVRHPGYAAAILMFTGIALSLGSWWALIPAGISAALLILRTRWEDQTLQAELPGYREYAQRVRYKMIPKVW